MRYGPTNKQIDIPQPVLDALAEGKLAIFAGSGVSRDPPSKYPDFNELAEEAKDAFRFEARAERPIDQYFGRLDRAYPNRVHEWLRKRFSTPGALPNPHHSTLLSLFRPPAGTSEDRHHQL